MEELKKVVVNNNILSYCYNMQKKTVHIPYYCILKNTKKYKLFAEFDGDSIVKLVASPDINSDSPQHETQILPSYNSTHIFTLKNGSKKRITFSLAITQKERKEAYCLIIREHYIPRPCPGLILIAKDESRIVGCIILSKLTYCNPKGRYQLAKESGNINEIIKNCDNSTYTWSSLMKSEHREQYMELHEKLQIAWISRFVVDSEYQTIGIGQHLLRILADVASKYRFPLANYIEVIASYKKESDIENNVFVFKAKQNIFQKAGYKMSDADMASPKLFFGNDDAPSTALKKYFYVSIVDLLRRRK